MVKPALILAIGSAIGILGSGVCSAADPAPAGTAAADAATLVAGKGCYARRLVNRPGEPLPWIHLDEGQVAYEVRGTFATLQCKGGRLVKVSPTRG